MATGDVQGPGADEPAPDARAESAAARSPSAGSLAARREALLADIRDPRFPVAMRGYDRETVDAYVQRVHEVMAELEATASPEAAIRDALEQVGEETSSILQRANETAAAITARSRSEAAERLNRAEREAQALREEAEAEVRRLAVDADGLWRERGGLIDELRGLAHRALDVAERSQTRFSAPATGELGGPEADSSPAQDTARLPVVEPADEAVAGNGAEPPLAEGEAADAGVAEPSLDEEPADRPPGDAPPEQRGGRRQPPAPGT